MDRSNIVYNKTQNEYFSNYSHLKNSVIKFREFLNEIAKTHGGDAEFILDTFYAIGHENKVDLDEI